MSEQFKDFDAARREHRREPIRFRLGGEDFTAQGFLPVGVWLETATTGLRGWEAILAFIREQLADDDNRQRLDALVRRRDVEVEAGDIDDVGAWLLECYTARPFERRSASAESPPPTSDTSRAALAAQEEPESSPSALVAS